MARPKRNVQATAEQALTPPETLQPNQTLVRVIKPEGNNLYTCLLPSKDILILELAQRFRNTIWIRRRGFVLAEYYGDTEEKSRAVGEIVNIVRDERLWRKQPYWPKEFVKMAETDSEDESNVGKMPPSDSEDE